ncbi:MAG: hypothetical protein EOP38_24945 [Rubrivivax sp.]|nr:MAG: hypothetical protein EOP38_24945 [Rubrivivax sp.]
MTTYAWPSTLVPASYEWGLNRKVVHFPSEGDFIQCVDRMRWAWTVNVNMPPRHTRNAGALEAFFNGLVGGVDRVTLHRLDRPRPKGTLRGAPVLAGPVQQFSNMLVLTGSTGVNLLRHPSFELGSTVATGWTGYVSGSASGVVSSIQTDTPAHGTKVQRVFASSASTVNAKIGVYQQVGSTLAPAIRAGRVHTLSAQVRYATGTMPASNVLIKAYISWRNAAGAQVSAASGDIASPGGAFVPVALTMTAPPGATWAYVYFWAEALAVVAGSFSIDVDAADFREGAAADFSPGGTLLAGDMIGVGSQLLQVASDSTFDGAGNTVVRTVNRTRSSLASGAAVVWDRPTATFMVQDTSSSFSFNPASMAASSFRLIEVP